MANHTATALLLLITVSGWASANPTEGDQVSTPSSGILRVTGIDSFVISDQIKIKPGGPSGSPPVPPYYCDSKDSLTIKSLAQIENVDEIRGAIETNDASDPKHLFTVINHNGLPKSYAFFSTRIDVQAYSPGIFRVWVFYLAEGKAYANSMRVICAWSQ